MNLTRCPTCHSRIHLDSLIQDDAGRDLFALIASHEKRTVAALVSYLACFRSATRDLANDRALRLATEVLQLHENIVVVTQALEETVNAMHTKQGKGTFKPLTNHRYLESVIESVAAAPEPGLNALSQSIQTGQKPASRTHQAIYLLSNYTTDKTPEWFTRTICGSLAELFTLGLESIPAYDTLPLVIERWLSELWPKRDWQTDCRFRGAKRLRDTIITVAESKKRWPMPSQVLEMIPKV